MHCDIAVASVPRPSPICAIMCGFNCAGEGNIYVQRGRPGNLMLQYIYGICVCIENQMCNWKSKCLLLPTK